jgi:thiol-disulfide isomerase/thioredoxin
MNRRPTAVTSVVLFALSCLCGTSLAADKSVDELAKEGHWDPNKWEFHSKLIGQPAPELQLSEWVGDKEVKVDDMRGKILVVDFWATWCGPCIAAIPKNNAIAKKYADNGVLVIGACGSGRGEEKMNDVATSKGMEYPTARVAASSTKAWGVQWWPHYVVVDREGKIRAAGIQPTAVEPIVQAIMKEQGDKPKTAQKSPGKQAK